MPARSRASPVLLAINHAVSCSRDAADNAVVPRMRACKFEAIAFGVVVSRGSSGKASLSEGSSRSNRVTWSPRLRAKAVSPGGPPMLASSKLPAVLSLRVSAASQISASVMPSPPTRFSVTGEFTTSADASNCYAPCQLFLAGIYPCQNRRGCQHFEGAAHRKTLVTPMDMTRVRCCLKDTNTQSAATLALQTLDLINQSLVRGRCPRRFRPAAHASRYQRCA